MRRALNIILVFLLLSGLYFLPALCQGQILAIGDGMLEFLPKMSVIGSIYRSLELPLWNPLEFAGFPLMGSIQHGVFYPPVAVLFTLLPAGLAYNILVVLHFALAGAFTYLLARQMGLGREASCLAGVVYAFLGYLPSHLQHTSILNSGAWLPLVVFFFERIRREPSFTNAIPAALAIAAQFYGGHPQTFLYSQFFVVLYVIFHLVATVEGQHRARYLAVCGAAFALSVIYALPQLLATRELSGLSNRAGIDYEFFSQFSLKPDMLPTFFFPFLYGGGYGVYAGLPESPFKTVQGYVGLLPLMLALTVAFKESRKNSTVAFFALAGALCFVLTLGDTIRPLYKLLFQIPGFNLFRAPDRHLLEVTLCFGLLSGFGLQRLMDEGSRAWYRKALGIEMGVFLLATIIALVAFKDQVNAMHGVGRSIRSTLGLANPVIYVPLVTAALYLVGLAALRRNPKLALWGVALVLLAEVFLYRVTLVYPQSYPQTYYTQTFTYLSSRKEQGRVLLAASSLRFMGLSMLKGIGLVQGYDPLVPKVYSDFLQMRFTGHSNNSWQQLLMANQALSVLNVTDIVMDESQQGMEAIRDILGQPVYKKTFAAEGLVVYENLKALPRAYGVTRVRAAGSLDEIRDAMLGLAIDIRTEAAVLTADLGEIGRSDFRPSTVTVRKYSPSEVLLDVEVQGPAQGAGFVVLSDQYYPGWRAFVDGKPARIFRTNAVARAVVVPGGGQHVVAFKYQPVALWVSIGVSLMALAFSVIAILRSSKGKATNEA